MTTPSKVSPLGFLDLPTEIRIEIYRRLLTAAHIIVPATQLITPPLPTCRLLWWLPKARLGHVLDYQK